MDTIDIQMQLVVWMGHTATYPLSARLHPQMHFKLMLRMTREDFVGIYTAIAVLV